MTSDDLLTVTGGCYCGAVRYRARDVNPHVTECHCSQCRRLSGHRYAATDARMSDVEIEGAENITWFRASPKAERGFCATCGSLLFWKSSTKDYTDLLAGTVDEPTGLRLVKHIFTANKGDYYDIADGLPQRPGDESEPASE
jgi:hypothetical protein